MRLRTLGLAAAMSAAMFQPSDAVVRPKGAEPPIVAADRAPRTHRTTVWKQLATSGLAGWTAIWDDDTNVPLRLMGKGAATPGAVADAAIAEAAARQFLAQHLATLAPGSSITDFEVVGNALSRNGDVRSVGFQQRASGVRVLGGAIGVSFKRDRIVLVSSTALPHVTVAPPVHRIAPATIIQRATEWLAAAGHQTRVLASATSSSERVIVPVVRPRTGATPDISYRVAEQLALESTKGPGRWTVWVDANDARPIARKTQIHYASGKVLYNVPDRYPASTRTARPAPQATHSVNSVATTSTVDGTVTWNTTTSSSVRLGLVGPLIAITNDAGALVADTLMLPVNGQVTFNKSADEAGDAQLSAFVHASIVKQFAKTRLNPNLGWLDGQLQVVVNEASTCNAYSTGDDIHFFRRDNQCENTGRLADVVYHEFGHSLHANSIIEGVGAFDGALSEGMSDVLSALITNDSGMGRGFLHSDAPLRELNPIGRELRWPDDITGEVHDDGEIIGGTMWDLQQALQQKLGAEAGFEKMLDLYYATLQRATDIPSTYAEVLLADDDDGDLTNGTPNQCEINSVFGIHGLADPSITLGLGTPIRDNYNVSIQATAGGNAACPGPTIAGATLEWKPRGGAGGSIPMTATGDTFAGTIPTAPDGTVVQYKVTLTFSDGSTVSFPNNKADPFYELYVGEVTTLWCSDFEAGSDGWTFAALPSSGNEWKVGMPAGVGGDPKMAFSGTNILGVDIDADGIYNNSTRQWAETPEIDLAGHTKVRLQYQRWLGVEDGFYDKARIFANTQQVWANYASLSDPQTSGIHHGDKEWRFHDVDLSAHTSTGKLKLRFELQSDEGLEFSGWNLDDVCVVAVTGAALTCGNGAVDDGETCDDGNRVDGDGCNANCTIDGEEPIDEGGGCCSAGGSPVAPLAMSVLTFGVLVGRRRRRR